MVDNGAVVMPADIVAAIADSTTAQGWLSGARLKSERVYVITSATLGEQKKVCEYFEQLITHRSWAISQGEPKELLLEWRRIEFDLFDRFPAYKWFNTAEIASTLNLDPDKLSQKTKRICVVESGSKGPKLKPIRILSQGGMSRLQLLDHILIPQVPQPFVRMPQPLTEALRARKVALVGVGSGGGEIALHLASAGVGNLTLFDYDRLEPENYIRHVLDRRDVGRMKTAGLTDALRDRTLDTNIVSYPADVLFWANEFRDILKEQAPDVLVCATDSRDSRRFLNVCAVGFGIPLVIAGILDAGRVGEVISVIPGETPCYECNRSRLRPALEEPEDDRPAVPYLDINQTESGSTSAVQRFDIGFVASLAARAILQFLDAEHYPRLPADYIVWGREKSEEHAAPFAFEHPLSLNYVPIPRRTDCPVCGDARQPTESTDARFAEILTELNQLPP